jgi:hypothetical protein
MLADATGQHFTRISRIENGIQPPTDRNIPDWCTACSADDQIPDLIATAQVVESAYWYGFLGAPDDTDATVAMKAERTAIALNPAKRIDVVLPDRLPGRLRPQPRQAPVRRGPGPVPALERHTPATCTPGHSRLRMANPTATAASPQTRSRRPSARPHPTSEYLQLVSWCIVNYCRCQSRLHCSVVSAEAPLSSRPQRISFGASAHTRLRSQCSPQEAPVLRMRS